MKSIKQMCQECKIVSPNGSVECIQFILGLIVDVRQYSNDWNNNINNKLHNLKDASQTWGYLLYKIGGKLKSRMCYLYLRMGL